jgi:hypothetical protein
MKSAGHRRIRYRGFGDPAYRSKPWRASSTVSLKLFAGLKARGSAAPLIAQQPSTRFRREPIPEPANASFLGGGATHTEIRLETSSSPLDSQIRYL